MSDIQPAARWHDHISHSRSELGGTIGMVLGGVVIGVMVVGGVFTEGTSTVAAIGLGATIINKGRSWGEAVGGFFTNAAAGEIAKGARTVFLSKEIRPAARMSDPVSCHSGGKIKLASKTVFVEDHNAARIHSKTSCGGEVSDACDNVFYGGPDVAADAKEVEEAKSLAYKLISTAVDWAELFSPEKRVERAIEKGLDTAADALGAGKEYGAAKDARDTYKALKDLKDGKGSSLKALKSVGKLGKDGKGLYDKYTAPEPEVVGGGDE